MKKLLVIGLDGLDWEYGQEALPKRFGNRVPARAQIGLTGVEWTSMLTGIPAPALGMYNFYGEYLGREIPGAQITYKDLEGYYFWEIAQAAGHSFGVYGAPACCPLRAPSDGWIVGGLGSYRSGPLQHFISSDPDQDPPPDPELSGDIARIVGSRVGHPDEKDITARWRRLLKGIGYEGFCNLVEFESEVAVGYIKKHPADVTFVYWRWLDLAVHYFHGHYASDPGKLNDIVRRWVDRLTQLAGGAPVFAMGDHGGKGGQHRDMTILAWNHAAGATVSEGRGPQRVSYAAGDKDRWMFKADVVVAPWVPSTKDVAATVLRPLGLEPRTSLLKSREYTPDELDVVETRLRDMGYF